MKHPIIYNLFLTTIISFTLIACSSDNNSESQEQISIVKEQDIDSYLTTSENEELATKIEEIVFWETKEVENPTFVYQTKLAGIYTSMFDLTGDIKYVHYTDSLLLKAKGNSFDINPSLLQALGANAIKQHQFKKAYEYYTEASAIKDNQYGSYLGLYDASMELGYYGQAEAILNNVEDKTDFNYLVRFSKWQDYIGNLDSAVALMEIAYSKVPESNTALKTWSLSNLGDMYGHQGNVEKSYNTYLEVLALDPHYHYALKGIAYIAFAHDNNNELAKEILIHLDENHQAPDYKLMLAEIEGFEENTSKEEEYIAAYYEKVTNPDYGIMYNTYILSIEAENFDNTQKAIELAQAEIDNRATPETYDILAWNYYLDGQVEKALEISQEYVENKTFEPNAIYHLGVLYKGVDDTKAQAYLEEAYDATFELGPNTTKNILELL